MTIEVFSADDYRSDIADWVELSVWTSTFKSLSSADVARARSITEDPHFGEGSYGGQLDQDVDLEIADLESESRMFDILTELSYRSDTLGDLYPFVILRDSGGWTLEKRRDAASLSVLAGRWTYVACLFATALRTERLLLEDEQRAELTKVTPELVQMLSVVAAAALVNGESFWMGWPREDRKQGMRAALEEFVHGLGHGVLSSEDPEWATGYEKDGTVDVIAWRRFADGTWASPILYGQVASGLNWRDKSVRTFLDSHFFEWFRHAPGAPVGTALAALFMPFPLHRDSAPHGSNDFDTVARGKARQDAKTYGIVVDRFRLAELVAERFHRVPTDDFVRRNGRSFWSVLIAWNKAVQGAT